MAHPLVDVLRELGMSQSELARRSGVNRVIVNRLCRGTRSGVSPSSAADLLHAIVATARHRRVSVNLSLAQLLTLTPAQRRAAHG